MKEVVIPANFQNKGLTKKSGLRRAPSSGGVKTATFQYSLPNPAEAVRNLLELASYSHLCSTMSGMHHRRAGFPFATLAEFSVDGAGHPVFCLSSLDIHTRNLLEDPRVSMVVQMPGWTGLANARVTIFGTVYQLPDNLRVQASEIFDKKQKTLRNEGWVAGNSLYFRMHHIQDIYFVGGFGTVQWVNVQEYLNAVPDEIVLGDVYTTLSVLNERYCEDLKEVLSINGESEIGFRKQIDDVVLISIDARGADVRVRIGHEFQVQRIGFQTLVANLPEASDALGEVLVKKKQKE